MELAGRLTRLLLRLTAAAIRTLAKCARAVFVTHPPDVFAWRDAAQVPPSVRGQPRAPLLILDPQLHSLMSFGAPAGAVLSLRVENVSRKPIRSFGLSYHSQDPPETGSRVWELEAALRPGQSRTVKLESRGGEGMTLWVECARFTDGSAWACADCGYTELYTDNAHIAYNVTRGDA